jgi:hypothetical protein
MGVPVPEGDRPALTTTVPSSDIAARLLRAVGVNPISGGTSSTETLPAKEIAARALRANGVNPADYTGTPIGHVYGPDEVGRRALIKMAVIAPDETPSVLDASLATAKVSAIHDLLVGLDYVDWPITQIPDKAVELYIIMTAHIAASDFEKPASLDAYKAAMDQVRMLALSGPTALARAEAKVATVHAEVAATGLADWTVSEIPTSVAEFYVDMVSQLLAPMYGGKLDQVAHDAALQRVRRVVLSGTRGQALAQAKVSAVHDSLIATGLVSWPLEAIPQAYAEDYVTMAVPVMAPVVGYAIDPQDRATLAGQRDAAEARIRRGAMIVGLQARAEVKVRSIQSELNGMGIASWGADAIPASMGDAYATLVAEMLGPDFGKEQNPKAFGINWDRVRQIAMGGPAGQALAEQKIRAVHASLDARGKTRWTLYDLPIYAEEPYVMMAAYMLAGEFQIKGDPSWWATAEVDLARIVSIPSDGGVVQACYF